MTANFSVQGWGVEDRHKYRVTLNDGEADFEEWWGFVLDDSPGQTGKYGNEAPGYFDAYQTTDDRWSHSWKLDGAAVNGKQADFWFDFGTDAKYHTGYRIRD